MGGMGGRGREALDVEPAREQTPFQWPAQTGLGMEFFQAIPGC